MRRVTLRDVRSSVRPRPRRLARLLAAGPLLLCGVLACGAPKAASPLPTPSTAPALTCATSERVTSPLGGATPVSYGAPAVSGGQSPVVVSCLPASGSVFPLGATTVTCTATDALQRVASCLLTVTVVPPPVIQVTRFVAFGDSITAGEDGTATQTVGLSDLNPIILIGREYPTVLQTSLRARYTTQTGSLAVANAGLPGEMTGAADTLTRFTRDVLRSSAQSLLLMEGANDLFDAYFGNTTAIPLAISNLQTMIRQAKGAGLRVYLATLPPQNPTGACVPVCRGIAAGLVPGFNDKLRALAVAEGVTLVDVYREFDGDLSLLSTDGLHPNALGFERIATAFFTAVKSTLES